MRRHLYEAREPDSPFSLEVPRRHDPTPPLPVDQRAGSRPIQLSAGAILALQRDAGNRAVQRLLSDQPVVQRESYLNDRHKCIATVIRKIIARLDANRDALAQEKYGGGGRVPSLGTLASQAVSGQLPNMFTRSKRAWQFAATGLLHSSEHHDTQIVYVANDVKPTEHGNPGLEHLATVPDLRESRTKPGGRVYHAETRLAAEGCEHISVTGGENCIFCALFMLAKRIPYTYHIGDVKSWHLPDNLSIAAYFGSDIDTYVAGAEFTASYAAPASAQALIDLLTTSNQYWWPDD